MADQHKKKNNKNKKKQFYKRQARLNERNNNCNNKFNKTALQDNLKGFLVTCNQKEYQCLQESYNILNEAAERIYPLVENNEPEPDSNDIEACIQREINNELKSTSRRFLQIKTKCHNLLFIRIQEDRLDPDKLMMSIWEELDRTAQQNCRYIQRIIPVLQTTKAEKVLECFEELFEQKADRCVCSYSVQCRVRNNSSFKEKQLQDQICQIVREKRPNWYVGLDRPDRFIQINIVCKAATISILKDYIRFAKYNICEFIKKKNKEPKQENSQNSAEISDKNASVDETTKSQIDPESEPP